MYTWSWVDQLRVWILFRLARRKCWGGKHMSLDNLPKGMDRNQSGEIKRIADELVKEGFVLAKPTHYGIEVSLNPRKKSEIEKIISQLGY